MKILLKTKGKKYPKKKFLRCFHCGTIIRATLHDCIQGRTVLNVPALYVPRPACGDDIYYHDGNLREALPLIEKTKSNREE